MSSNPLYDLIHQGEAGVAGYEAYNRGTYRDDDGVVRMNPQGQHVDVSSLTIADIQAKMALGSRDPDRLFAVGEYQIIPRTLEGAIDSLNLDTTQNFSREIQDQIYSQYLIVEKRPQVHDYIAGNPGVSLEDAQTALACEWASFGDPTRNGDSHYPLPNVASVSLAQSGLALNQMRASYKADIDSGMSPGQAWNAATASSVAPVQQQTAGNATAGSVLVKGDHGDAVRDVQMQLAQLGYTDTHGHVLHPDASFGPATKAAVEAFQHDHGLTPDGKVGTLTLAAIEKQYEAQGSMACRLDDPKHPDALLYLQVQSAVHRLDAGQGRASDQHSDNLAAVLTVAARRDGLTCVDHAALSDDASKVFVMQGEPGSPFNRYASVPTMEGVEASVAQSSAQWLQLPMDGMQSPQPMERQDMSQATTIPQQAAGAIMQR